METEKRRSKYFLVDVENVSNVHFKILLLNIDSKDPTQVKMELTFSGPDFAFTAKLDYDEAVLIEIYTEIIHFVLLLVCNIGGFHSSLECVSTAEENRDHPPEHCEQDIFVDDGGV